MALRARLHASHEPITRLPGGVARDRLKRYRGAEGAERRGADAAERCGAGAGRPAFDRVNASLSIYLCYHSELFAWLCLVVLTEHWLVSERWTNT